MAKRDKIIKEMYIRDELWLAVRDELCSKIRLTHSAIDYRVYCELRHTVQAEVARSSGVLTKYSASWKDRVEV